MPENRYTFSPDHDACGVGFVAQLGGPDSHDVVERALVALARLEHRGGVDADGRSGDGAGLLTAIPQEFFRTRAREIGTELPDVFGLGMVFLPEQEAGRARFAVEEAALKVGLRCVAWRDVPVNCSLLGPRSLRTVPRICQCFLTGGGSEHKMELRLYQLRQQVRLADPRIYFCSLSSRTVVYKGLLTPDQLPAFYPDLSDAEFTSRFAIFHQRYSTNTEPSWRLAQPFRLAAHNGEINTISGNRRWFRAREPALHTKLGLPEGLSLLEPGMSDSASFDNALEVSLQQGIALPEAVSRLIPPAWENDHIMTPGLHAFFQENARAQEPWDGPAAIVFSDGRMVGAKLDRNGLRPLRYSLTTDGLLTVGSEVGIGDFYGKDVIERGRLGPGEMLLADLETGKLLRPADVVKSLPQRTLLSSHLMLPRDVSEKISATSDAEAKRKMVAMGWTEDQFRMLFRPLAENGQDGLWSMGDDTPPAFLSGIRRTLWDFCKQRFAQVTNPPIDPLRESHVMSLDVPIGDHFLASPVLGIGQLEILIQTMHPCHTIDFTFEVSGRIEGARARLAEIDQQVLALTKSRPKLVLLSDRTVDSNRAALPALLAISAAWRAMVQGGLLDVPLIIETGQAFDTHHIAMLVAVGASAVHPYLALGIAASLHSRGPELLLNALDKGLCRVLARMGISTIASYRNSQLLETIGLDDEVTSEFFENAGHNLAGKSLGEILADCLVAHAAGYGAPDAEFRDEGHYRFRHNGERHANSPELVRRMQRYVKFPSPENHDSLTLLSDERKSVAIRDLLETLPGTPLDVSNVESEASLLSRFSTQAMSLGAISPEAHQTLAVAMNRLGARSNTGEGGEDPRIYRDNPGSNNRVKQVASGRFGVTAEYLVHADELEIKMAQGSKPGEGGQLPAIKVTPYIATLRHAVPGTMLISPPPHHDIYSIEDLAQLIYDLRAINPRARIGVKLVSTSGVGIIAAGVAKAGADVITISGHDGGTGASPLTSIRNTAIPWEIGLRETHVALVKSGLRARVRLRVDGGLKFARDVMVAALLGAEEFGFGTAALLAIGCVMARQCHLNTCPVGIATQNEVLRARFSGSPEMVETYFRTLAADVRQMLADLGASSIDEIMGDVSRLWPRDSRDTTTLSTILAPIADAPPQIARPRVEPNALHAELNRVVSEMESLSGRQHRFRITNRDLAVGAHLSGEMLRLSGSTPPVTGVECKFVGTAGQSFGAFLTSGVVFHLTGEANDYVAKGLCGATISINAGAEASRRGDVLVGNTVLYGATSGELYVAGRAGERFAVRNSGALAVVEGTGQHACEYMTAGVVVLLGPVGMNLGAGMTGGLAYVLPEVYAEVHSDQCNGQSVRLASLDAAEERWLRRVLRRHVILTGSPRGAQLLSMGHLPLLRVEPLQPPCSIEQAWDQILSRLALGENQSIGIPRLPFGKNGTAQTLINLESRACQNDDPCLNGQPLLHHPPVHFALSGRTSTSSRTQRIAARPVPVKT